MGRQLTVLVAVCMWMLAACDGGDDGGKGGRSATDPGIAFADGVEIHTAFWLGCAIHGGVLKAGYWSHYGLANVEVAGGDCAGEKPRLSVAAGTDGVAGVAWVDATTNSVKLVGDDSSVANIASLHSGNATKWAYVAVGADGNLHAVFKDFKMETENAGYSLLRHRKGEGAVDGLEEFGEGCSVPEASRDKDGNLHLVCDRSTASVPGLYYFHNLPGSFVDFRVAETVLGMLAVTTDSGGYAYILDGEKKTADAPAQVGIKMYTNKDGPFAESVAVAGVAVESLGIAVAGDGIVHIVYEQADEADGNAVAWYANNSTGSFVPKKITAAFDREVVDPVIAADSTGGIHALLGTHAGTGGLVYGRPADQELPLYDLLSEVEGFLNSQPVISVK